ncbi:MAG: hypothetical protein JW957_03320 [Candidatus Omnitrophica bacterium]|nr:hypothetical protein [Candidatus Omnitrophota bacterium]
MKQFKSIVVFHQFIIPVKETIDIVKDVADRFPEHRIYFCGNRKHLKQSDIDTLKTIVPAQNFFLYHGTGKLSEIKYFFMLKKQKFDTGIIPVLPCHAFPVSYRKVLFIALSSTKQILAYHVDKRHFSVIKRSIFYKLLWYDFFALCLFVTLFPASVILAAMLVYSDFLSKKRGKKPDINLKS